MNFSFQALKASGIQKKTAPGAGSGFDKENA